MTAQYLENPVLLVNTCGPVVASGRNVRAKFRTNQASKRIQAEKGNGQFGVFELDQNIYQAAQQLPFTGNKRSKSANKGTEPNADVTVQRPNKSRRTNSSPDQLLYDSFSSANSVRYISNLLDYATFHIRLLAALTVTTTHARLKHILLCRQWSYVYSASERFGKNRVLDSALFCVAARVNRLSGTGATFLDDVLLYNKALAELHGALENPEQHDLKDLRISSQLLAIYEMLESVDGSGWEVHISGARLLSQPQAAVLKVDKHGLDSVCALTVPMVAEALIVGNNKLFENETWRCLLLSTCDNYAPLHDIHSAWVTCMLDLPLLISDTKMLCSSNNSGTMLKQSLLNRALLLKSRIRSELLTNDEEVHNNERRGNVFDRVGLCLAGLIALDRMIASIEASDIAAQKIAEAKTAELCERILQLDLGASGAYAAYDLMMAFSLSPFQEQAGYIIALPGRKDS